MTASETETGRRRLDRIQKPEYSVGLDSLDLDEIRTRRDECLAEREYLSYLRRMVQGRIEILRAEQEARESGEEVPLVDRLAVIFANESPQGPSRGEALRLGLPEDEMALARRSVERMVSDVALSDPGGMSEAELADAIVALEREEREVSDVRRVVMDAHDLFQGEIKRRYKERLSS